MTNATLIETELTILMALSNSGADIWGLHEAHLCRALEKKGLVRIVKARGAPKDGAMRQPYFGAKITAAGKKELTAEGHRRRFDSKISEKI